MHCIMRLYTSWLKVYVALPRAPSREEGCLQADCDLAALRQAVMLLEAEVLLEGWAAEGGPVSRQVLGLFIVTNWRVAFADVEGGFTAFPIFKIDYVERGPSSQVTMSVWYSRLHLSFDSPVIAASVMNLLRQDPNWNAAEVTLAHQELEGVDRCLGLQGIAADKNDRRAGALATVA
jgi:hypothetical protein